MNALEIEKVDGVAPYAPSGFQVTVLNDASDLDILLGGSRRCVQLTPGRFCAELATLRLGPVTIAELSCNRGIHVTRSPRPDSLIIAAIRKSQMVWEHGRPWTGSDVLVNWGAQIELSALAPLDILWLQIDRISLSPAFQTWTSHNAGEASYIASGSTDTFERLWDYSAWMLRSHLRHKAGLPDRDSYYETENRLMALAAGALSGAEPRHFDTKTTRARYALVERVVQYMWENVEEPLTLERICSDMHCRMRSLIYSFKNTVGIGPMTYLKILRLNAARQKLKSVGNGKRIFDVAADFGFWHMGHFSADYKRLFGTTASQTIATASPAGPRSFAHN